MKPNTIIPLLLGLAVPTAAMVRADKPNIVFILADDAIVGTPLPDTAPDAPGQLYNLESDPGETTNLYFKHPEVVKELKALLESSKAEGRSAAKKAKP